MSIMPLHLTAPGPARACSSRRGAIVDARVPQVSGRTLPDKHGSVTGTCSRGKGHVD